MPSGPTIILGLKIAVIAVTLILIAALIALARGNYRLHGRLNIVFFTLTMIAVVVFEGLLRLGADVTSHMNDAERLALKIHLCFAIPLPPVMITMLYSGLTHRRKLHLAVSVLFSVLWLGTFVMGVFFLPHAAKP
jgi:uncharacterized membrane protein YozB (DUF420 family)